MNTRLKLSLKIEISQGIFDKLCQLFLLLYDDDDEKHFCHFVMPYLKKKIEEKDSDP